MVEIFKTNVNDRHEAEKLIGKLAIAFPAYASNFDLEDCDRILRVETFSGSIQVSGLIEFLLHSGIHAEILPDEVPSPGPLSVLI